MRSALVALLAVLGLTFAVATSSRADERDVTAAEVRDTREALLAVESTLRSHDTSALEPAQRAARERALAELHRYALAGVFPHNHGSAEPKPIFVDEHGTLCAFANLVAFSGRGDYVKQVAAAHNDAKVADLARDAEVTSWSRESGISLEEAASIQRPAYRPTPREKADDVAVITSRHRTGVVAKR